MTFWRGIAVGAAVVAFAGVGCGGNATSGTSGTGASGGSGASGGTGATGATGGTGATGATGGTGGVGGNCGAAAKSCAVTSDCILTAASCCVCSKPQLSDYIAINKAQQKSCVCQGPACGCAAAPNPYLGATCKSGTCTGFDVQQIDALSACSSDADCTLRMGLGCCPACSGSQVVALRAGAESTLAKLVCDNGAPQPCPACAPVFPPNTHAACVQGRCQVVTQ